MGLVKKWQIEKSNTLTLEDNIVEFKTYDAPKSYVYSTSEVYHSNDRERGRGDTSYYLVKEIALGSDWPDTTVRVSIDYKSMNSGQVSYIKLAVFNGSAETVLGEWSTTSNSYTTKAVDANIAAGYALRVYGRVPNSSYGYYVRNFRILGTTKTYAALGSIYNTQLALFISNSLVQSGVKYSCINTKE